MPASRRRIETRFLVRDTTATGVYGVTYRWDDLQTNAWLVPEQGMEDMFTIQEEHNMTRSQAWRYPSRSQCLACHTAPAGRALGFNTSQLNRDCVSEGTVDNQIRALNNSGYFLNAISNINQLPRLAAAADESVSVEYRVRSYLMANCAHCHQPGGSATLLAQHLFKLQFRAHLPHQLFLGVNSIIQRPTACLQKVITDI